MAITNLGAFRYIGLDADIATLPLNIEAGAIFDAYDTNRKFVWNGIAWIEFTSAVSGDTVILNGQSTDTKPTVDVMFSTRFIENDTGRTYVWDGINWNYENIDDESANFNELQPRSSFIQLFGDTFATTSASELYTLENLDSSAGGVTLTNNGTVLFTQAEDLPLRGYLVPNFNGIDQWLSTPTNSNIEVGTNSFVASIQFKTSVKDVFQTLFYYGNNDDINWHLSIDSSNAIRVQVKNTVANTFVDSIPNRWQDGKWHTATMVWDKTQTLDTLSLTIDGEKIGELGVDLGTLTNAIDGLRIGARLNVATTQRFFQGQLANFQLYIAAPAASPDYNLPSLLHAGIRESATLGTIVIPVPDDTLRINNKFIIPSVSGNYSSSVINTSEGYYEIIQIEKTGTEKISIDGNEIIDQSNLFLSEGSHIIKYENTLASSLQFACLELIKRNGKDEGDDESSSGVLFGDEIQEQSSGGLNNTTDGGAVYNNFIANTDNVAGSFREGRIFIKKGLYKITLTYDQDDSANRGIIDLFFGGVKVFDQLDISGASQNNTQATRSVFLEGGQTNVKIVVTGSSGAGNFYIFNSIRYELVTGKSNGDTVNIWSADEDFQIVSGNVPTLSAQPSVRFNHTLSNDAGGLNDEILTNRYFSGGSYQFEYLYEKRSSSGVTDIFWDDTSNLIIQVDQYNVSTLRNQLAFVTVTIPRGFHSIHIKNVLAGTEGAFRWGHTRLQFKKIGTVLSAELDDNSDPVHGALVPLAKYVAPTDESDITLELGGTENYDSYEIAISLKDYTIGADNILAEFNGDITAVYVQDGSIFAGGVATPIDIGSTSFTIFSSTIHPNNSPVFATIKLMNSATADGELKGVLNSTGTNGFVITSLSMANTTNNPFRSFRLFAPNNWLAGSTITVYGVLK